MVLWGAGTLLCEFLWSEDMADASVHVLLNVGFEGTVEFDVSKTVRTVCQSKGVAREMEGRSNGVA